jgi:Xaa-Pro aminopeptidase
MAEEKQIREFHVEAGTTLYNEDFPLYEGRSFPTQVSDLWQFIDVARMRKERLARARKCMKEAGASLMLLLRHENRQYTTGYTTQMKEQGDGYVILPMEGDLRVFCWLLAWMQLRRHVTWIKPEHILPLPGRVVDSKAQIANPPLWGYLGNQFAKTIKNTLEEMGMAKEVLTLDYGDPDLIEVLKNGGIKFDVKPEIMIKAQEIKTQDEIECIRVAATIDELAHYELAKFAEPGKTEAELAGWMNYIAMKNGAEPWPKCYVTSGQFTHPINPWPSTKMLRIGDLFYADTIAISWNGYKTCMYRNYSCVTPPSQRAKDVMKKANDCMDAMISEVKPGATTADVWKHFPPEWKGGGMHGIGLKNYGPPSSGYPLSFQYPYELKEGHVFAIESLSINVGDGQGLKTEDMVVVTKTGHEILTRLAREIVTTPSEYKIL